MASMVSFLCDSWRCFPVIHSNPLFIMKEKLVFFLYSGEWINIVGGRDIWSKQNGNGKPNFQDKIQHFQRCLFGYISSRILKEKILNYKNI